MDNEKDLSQLKANEMSIFEKWKKTQDPVHFRALYTSMKGLIHRAASKAAYGSNLPESAHRAFAAQAFYDALRNYDPKGGASLSTFVHKSVENKTKRLNYLYQNLGSMPEPASQTVGLYQTEYGSLRESLGREPSTAEIADKMNMSISRVATIQKGLRRELGMGEGTEEVAFAEGSKDEERLNYLYYDLNPEEKVVFEYLFGKYGKPRLIKPNGKVDFDRIAMQVGVSTTKVRSIYGHIRTKFAKVLR